MKFLQWLKFYSLAFFTVRYSREATSRRALNALLGAISAFVLLFGGMMLGYSTSFGTHYKTADEFRDFLYAAFADDSESRIQFSVVDGVPEAAIPDRETVNSYRDGVYRRNGYELIIDFRPAGSTFAEFTAYYKSKDGKEITEAEYSELPEDEKSGYSLDIEYSGERLDTSVAHSKYVAYLEGASAEGADGYDEDIASKFADLKEKKEAGELTEAVYADEIYCLYISARYPALAQDAYGGAPTLRSYYMRLLRLDADSRYMMMLDDRCVCAFVNDKGISMLIDGNYGNANIALTAETAPQDAASALDGFIGGVFSSVRSIDAGLYFVNLMTALPFLLIAFAVTVVVLILAGKFGHSDHVNGVWGALKTVGSFLFVSGAAAFISAIIFSRLFSRSSAYMYTLYVFVAVFAVRTIVQAVVEIVSARKNKQTVRDDLGDDGASVADEAAPPQEQ